jgi:hypothetical protein
VKISTLVFHFFPNFSYTPRHYIIYAVHKELDVIRRDRLL